MQSKCREWLSLEGGLTRQRHTGGSALFEVFDVGKVAKTAHGALVDDEFIPADDRNGPTFDTSLDTRRPGVLEFHPGDRSQQIDAIRCTPDLVDDTGGCQIVHCQFVERSAEGQKRIPHAPGILGDCANPETEIARCPRPSVNGKSMGPDHEKISAGRG